MHEYLHILSNGETLTEEQAAGAMHAMLDGAADPEEMAALLLGMRSRGETVEELVGFTRTMRKHAISVTCEDPHAIDLCGTGGDSLGTFNISTAAAFVCAGAGVTVAKHGNRSVSSQSGSADVLEALGIQAELEKEGVEFCLREVGMAFIYAPLFHPAMRHVMPVRRKLRVRTAFNILGPLCNPAGVRRQLIGAFSPEVAQVAANILAELGAEHIISVHSNDGMDEISLSAPTNIFEYEADIDTEAMPTAPEGISVDPEAHGFARVPIERIRGGSAEDNADILRRIFDGAESPHRDITILNAAYALHASDAFESLDECFTATRESIDGGRARQVLERLVDASRSAPAKQHPPKRQRERQS